MNFNDFTPNSKFGVLLPNLELHDLCAQSCHLKTRFSFKQINEVYSFGRPHCWCWIDKPPTESWYALFIRPSTLLVLNRQTTNWILICSIHSAVHIVGVEQTNHRLNLKMLVFITPDISYVFRTNAAGSARWQCSRSNICVLLQNIVLHSSNGVI